MKARQLAFSCAVVTMAFATGALANEIYKWTDENGHVHYEDRPSGSPTEERMEIVYRRTDNSAVNQRIQARLSRQAERDEAKSIAATAEQEAAEREAAAAERAQTCERARARLQTYLDSHRLYRTDENGERVYLDDAQRQEALQNVEDQITRFCD